MLFWSLIFLLPQSGIFPINASIAEHFIYLSSISFFMLVSFLLYKYLKRQIFIAALLGLCLFYASLTAARNYEWSDPTVFYEKLVRVSPQSFQAHNNLGYLYEHRYLYDKAIGEYKKALEIQPDLIESRSNLANIYFRSGRFQEAKKEYAIVELTGPGSKAGEVQNNIGAIYETEGSLDQALAKYQLALKLDPNLYFTYFNVARVYFMRKDYQAAARQILASLGEFKPDPGGTERYPEVIRGYLASLKDMNCSASFYNNLGVKFAGSNFLEAAIPCFQRVLDLEPQNADAHFNLGLAHWKNGFKRRAIFEFKTALKLNPNHAKAKGFLSEIVYKK